MTRHIEENIFDINEILLIVYKNTEHVRIQKKLELIFDMDRHLPRFLKGDGRSLILLFSQILFFVSKYAKRQVVVSLSAPENFFYIESITIKFDLRTVDINPYRLEDFFSRRLQKNIELLHTKINYNEQNDCVKMLIPFEVARFGNKRNYHLPSMRMVGLNVLLLTSNKDLSLAVKRMLEYFLYNVDIDVESYRDKGSDLAYYDIFILDEELVTIEILRHVEKIKRQKDLKFVICTYHREKEPSFSSKIVDDYIVRPVLQKSIFNMICRLYQNVDPQTKNERTRQSQSNISPGAIEKTLTDEMRCFLKNIPVMQNPIGRNQRRISQERYRDMLEKFIKDFARSEYYLSDIIAKRMETEVKKFAKDLEREALVLGLPRLSKVAQHLHTIYLYNQWDKSQSILDAYHIELKKTLIEIMNYLKAYSRAS